MLPPKHLTKKIKGDYRLIAISDIHGHLERFKELLRKVHYDPYEDYLVILGDFVEKGDQVLETIHFVEQLSHYKRCYVMMGNCEWALSALLTIPEIAGEIPKYLKRASSNGAIRYYYEKEHLGDGHETPLGVQKVIEEKMHEELKFMMHLPVTLKFNDFIFVHAGLESRDNYKECGLSSYLEMQRFLELGHPYKETVIVGHLPTSNYDPTHINNDIIIDEKKRIICIDGGTGVKPVSQLNALIIQSKQGHIALSKESVQPLPMAILLKDLEDRGTLDHKISYPNFKVEVVMEGDAFSQCFQEETSQLLMIKNEFLYERKNEWYCLDDYTDHWLVGKAGDEIKVMGVYGDYAYVIKDDQVGWIRKGDMKEDE